LRKTADTDPQVVNLIRARLLGRPVDLKRKPGEQMVYLFDSVLADWSGGGHDLTLVRVSGN